MFVIKNQQQQNTPRYITNRSKRTILSPENYYFIMSYYFTAIMECKDNDCLVHGYSLNFPLMINVTKIGQFHV